jgi:transposase
MLTLPASARILLCAEPCDLRKSFDSLALLVRQALGSDPLSGQLFVFRNKSGDRVKILVWEGDGFAIWYKRLEEGTFRFPAAADNQASIAVRAAELAMLLDGVDLTSVRRRKRYQRLAPA